MMDALTYSEREYSKVLRKVRFLPVHDARKVLIEALEAAWMDGAAKAKESEAA